jgi:hypothetical protein
MKKISPTPCVFQLISEGQKLKCKMNRPTPSKNRLISIGKKGGKQIGTWK